ncbi:MAG TPA: DNA-processing protein DprA [Sediminibacterium sp.]|nr:DNA-processing protein DprA [Sediminibacterium sp.]
MPEEIICRIALTFIPDLGPVRTRCLIEQLGSAQDIFKASVKQLAAIGGISVAAARQIREWKDFSQAEKELHFAEKRNIRLLFLTDAAYPKRLKHCFDPPVLLYYRGNADLNHPRILSIIGTRQPSDYGKQVTLQLFDELRDSNILIVSGLALGIDALAHRQALKAGLATVGVMAHGHDRLYPYVHKALSDEMVVQGGLLTEYPQQTQPDRHNFPKRNRIVAGIADATLVIETAVRGGSMITAELAYGYNRDVFAVPGRLSDYRSSGCLYLIQQQKALLFSDIRLMMESMGWIKPRKKIPSQRILFPELGPDEQVIVSRLSGGTECHVDELSLSSGLPASRVAAAILNLELQQVIQALPGKRYCLL